MGNPADELANALCFNDGYVLDAHHIFLASQIRKYAHVDASRIAVIIDNQWKYADYDKDALVSVACRHSDGLAFFLGYNGNILVGGRRKPAYESLEDCRRYGNALRIRNIRDEIYACGMSGQVYRREENRWVHIDSKILGTDGLDFEDIGGTGRNNIYAVGTFGNVQHFDGTHWRQVYFPTNLSLSGIKCISEEEVYICGDNGTLFKGSGDRWEYIGDPEVDHNFWSVEMYSGDLFVSYESGIFKHDGRDFKEIDFGIGREVDCHRLHANDGVLWSFGVDDLLYFDGQAWAEVICPMNVP